MTEETKDSLLEALRDAPVADVDAWRAENLRRRARAELVDAAGPTRGRRLYRRVVEPLAVAGLSGGWLFWAAQRVLTIYGG